MDSEPVKAFNAELASVYDTKPPITKKKIQDISKAALKGIKFYKHIVFSVERFLAKCQPEYKIPCLYIIDAIIRQSKHTFKQKDVFGPRFEKNMLDTIEKLHTCPDEDKPKIARTLNLWISNEVYPAETVNAFLNICKTYGIETDVEKVERIVKGDKANMAIYDGGKPRLEKDQRKEKHHRERTEPRQSRFEATTPPGPPPEASLLNLAPFSGPGLAPSDQTPENGISEKTLIRLMQRNGVDFGGAFTADVGLLKQAHAIFLPRLYDRIEKIQEERGDNIKHVLSRDFDYSDEEDGIEEPPKRLSNFEIESVAEELLRDQNILRSLQGLQVDRLNVLNKIAMEAKQKAIAASQAQPSTSSLPPNMQHLPKLPGMSTSVPPPLHGLPPGMQLPNLAGIAGLGQQGMPPLNSALVNLLSGNPLFAAVQPPGLPPNLGGLPNLPQTSMASNLPPGFPGGITGLQQPPTSAPSVNIANFMPNRPPPNLLPQMANIQQLMQQQQQQQRQQLKQHGAAQAQQEAQKIEVANARLRSDMERAMEERMESGRQEERDRKDRDRRRDGGDRRDRSVERNRDRQDGSRDRRRSRSRERRDRRRRSRSGERSGPRDPRDQNKTSGNDGDHDKERQRRHLGLPSRPKPEHLTVASCTLWFGRLPTNCSEDEIKEALKDIGTPKRILLVGSRACAYVTMNDRRTAFNVFDKFERRMEIRGKSTKLSWAVGPGLKNSESKYGEFWDEERGISQIPWPSLPANLVEIIEGSWIDISTLPEHLIGKVDEFAQNTSVGMPINPLTGAPMPQLAGLPGTLGAQFVLPPPGLGMTGAPGMTSNFMGAPHGIPAPGMVGAPGMVPPPSMGSFGMPGQMRPQGTGPHTPTKPPPTDAQSVVQQQFAALAGGNGFPTPIPGQAFPQTPPGMTPNFGFPPPNRGGFAGAPRGFQGGVRGARGYNGSPGDRGGYRGRGNPNFRGQWRGRGDGQFSFNRGGGFSGQVPFMPMQQMRNFPVIQPNFGQPNDDAQVTSTVNDEDSITESARPIETVGAKNFEFIDGQPMDETKDE